MALTQKPVSKTVLTLFYVGCGLYDAVHEPRHHHPVHETRQAGPELVLLPLAPLPRSLDLYGDGLPRGLSTPLHAR